MTTLAEIIRSAYREGDLIPIARDPTPAEQAEALPRLQSLLASVLGNEAGEKLETLPIGNNNISAPLGYPAWQPLISWWAPLNVRLVCNLTGATPINLNPMPEDGSRLAVQDMSGNFATYPLTLVGNRGHDQRPDQHHARCRRLCRRVVLPRRSGRLASRHAADDQRRHAVPDRLRRHVHHHAQSAPQPPQWAADEQRDRRGDGARENAVPGALSADRHHRGRSRHTSPQPPDLYQRSALGSGGYGPRWSFYSGWP